MAPNCPQCGTQLASDAPRGLCPECLLRGGFSDHGLASTSFAGRFVAPEPEELAEHFPQLEILELLGQGGMGAVYLARQRSLERTVALKILPPEVGRDPAFAERFAREARALAKLTHPNIVAVYDFGEQSGYYYLMMEYVDGVNLRQAIRAGTLEADQALELVRQICEALQYAHDEGVVHRDIKPENVLLDQKNRLKIADFGLAKLLGKSPVDVTLTATDQVMGTFHYMAPEQLERPNQVDHRADLYSLGVVFYELLTGQLPLGRFDLPSEKKALDQRLDGVVLKTLEREPEARYQHASDIKSDVEQISRAADPVIAKIPPVVAQAVGETRMLTFTVSKHGAQAGAGLARLEPHGLVLEMDVQPWITQHDTRLSPGFHEFRIDLKDIADVNLHHGWLSTSVDIQASSLRTLDRIPTASAGCLRLTVAKSAATNAAEFVDGLREATHRPKSPVQPEMTEAAVQRVVTPAGSKDLDPASIETVFHPGKFLFGLVMISLGGCLFALWNLAGGQEQHLVLGIGMMLGGGGVLASAWLKPKVPPPTALSNMMLGQVLMGLVMIAIGIGLLVAGFTQDEDGLFWVGFGLIVGGGGVISSGWDLLTGHEAQAKIDRDHRATQLTPDARDRIARKLGFSGTGLVVAGIVDIVGTVIMIGAIATQVILVATDSAGGPATLVFFIYLTVLAILHLTFGIFLILAGFRFNTLEHYGLSIIASLLSILPLHLGWLVGAPFGMMSLWMLTRRDVRSAFRWMESQPVSDQAPMTAKPTKPSSYANDIPQRLKIPAIGLLAISGLNVLAPIACIGFLALAMGEGFGTPGFMELIILSFPFLTGLATVVGSISMLRCNNYGLAVFGAAVALVPLSPLWLFSAPFAVWALIVLNASEARESFD